MASNLNPSKPFQTMISNVRVILRVRPFLQHEFSSKNLNPCISLLPKDHFVSTPEVSVHLKDQQTSRNECYKLDGYFDQNDDNVGKIFEKEVKRLIPEIFSGCNATVFAYGATGSGKTFTMQGRDEQPGLMTLAMSNVLSMCEATGNIAAVSYYEVYLERCYDLLDFKEKEIFVLDDKDGQIHMRGLCRVPVTSLLEFNHVFARGLQRRKAAHTSLNHVSSRSHAVLVISVTSSDNALQGPILGKMNLIDLAGNEDNKISGNQGIRLQESAKINQSLFALSNVIYALNNNKPWIPYRESKLTRVLQDSLGGTSRSLMVACVSPGNYLEAVHTVALAARSRNISNVLFSGQKQETPKVRIDMEAKLKVWLESKGKTKGPRRVEAFGSPFFLKTPDHGSSIKKPFVQTSSVKNKVAYQENPGVLDRFVPQRKLFDNSEAISEYGIQVKELSEKDISEDRLLDDELLEKDERAKNRADNDIHSSDNRPKILSRQSPLRKALSPINCNISNSAMKEISSREDMLSAFLVTSTPNTPLIVSRENPQDFKTPLEKFSACSSNLKSHLVQEYIDFLNSATRDELVQLKGIGVKRAEYIMEVRESSPLKSLSDLQMIGLSSKQVQQLFGKAAKGILE
ncbi:hypothetical protein KSS87_003763 [Heliosperma pusillum]|nr:hypothetical protein KSS87_003763 [Heliosperma pusillum]